MKKTKNTILLTTMFAMVLPALSFAQTGNAQPPRGPDFAALAADLGVSEDAVQTCLPRPERTTEGQAPARPDLSDVASCLQARGSQMTSDQITTILESNRPARPPQQG